MDPSNDWHLIDEYAATGSHAAFDVLVKRHAGWVYATALRRVRSVDLADDVTQAAFIVLARKAGSIGRRESLAAWLYRVVTYVAIDAVRRRGTRLRHERLAAKPEASPPADEHQEVIAHLDAALDSLGRRDREAIVLRYFSDQTLAQIGDAQRVAASTVQRRLTRSLARMAYHLKRHGIAASPAALPATLAAIGTLTAPASATHGLTALATAAGALTANTAGPIGLANGAMKTMTLVKLKFAAAASAAFALLGAGGTVVTHYALSQTPPRPAAIADAAPGARGSATPRVLDAAAADVAPQNDAEFARRFKADWESIDLQISRVNAANPDTKGRSDSEALRVEARLSVSDATNLIGFDRVAHATTFHRESTTAPSALRPNLTVTRTVDDEGHDLTALVARADEDEPSPHWYAPLGYDYHVDPRTHEFADTLAPARFGFALTVAPQLLRNLAAVDGYLIALTCDRTIDVEIPYIPNGPPVQVLPGVRMHFTSADQSGSSYSYSLVSDEPQTHPSFTGLLQPGETPPNVMIVRKLLLNEAGKPIASQRHATGIFPGSASQKDSGTFNNADKIAALRFVVATGLHERKVPIVLKNIDLPQLPH